jgi:hypothetical protein
MSSEISPANQSITSNNSFSNRLATATSNLSSYVPDYRRFVDGSGVSTSVHSMTAKISSLGNFFTFQKTNLTIQEIAATELQKAAVLQQVNILEEENHEEKDYVVIKKVETENQVPSTAIVALPIQSNRLLNTLGSAFSTTGNGVAIGASYIKMGAVISRQKTVSFAIAVKTTVENVKQGTAAANNAVALGGRLVNKVIRFNDLRNRINRFEDGLGRIKYAKYLIRPYDFFAKPIADKISETLLQQAQSLTVYANTREKLKEAILLYMQEPQKMQTYAMMASSVLRSLPIAAYGDAAAGALDGIGSVEFEVTQMYSEVETALSSIGMTSIKNRVTGYRNQMEERVQTEKIKMAYKVIDFIPTLLINFIFIKIISGIANSYCPLEPMAEPLYRFNDQTGLNVKEDYLIWTFTAIYLIGFINTLREWHEIVPEQQEEQNSSPKIEEIKD